MAKNFVIVPDSVEQPYQGEAWIEGYADQLNNSWGITASIMPPPDEASATAQEWVDAATLTLSEIRHRKEGDLSLIGHGLGGVAVLRYLESLHIDPDNRWDPFKAGTVILIGTPIGIDPIENKEQIETYSGGFDFDWEAIARSAYEFSVIHSFDDEVVDVANAPTLAQNIGTGATVTATGGHFNEPEGTERLLALLPIYGRN